MPFRVAAEACYLVAICWRAFVCACCFCFVCAAVLCALAVLACGSLFVRALLNYSRGSCNHVG